MTGWDPYACPECGADQQPGFEQSHADECPRRVPTDAELDAAERRLSAALGPTSWDLHGRQSSSDPP